MPEAKSTFKFEASGALTTTGVKDRWVAPLAGDILEVVATVGTQPTGSSLIFDIQKNGATIYTTTANRPTIAPSTSTSTWANASGDPDVRSFATGDVLSLTVTQIGSTVAGSDADVVVSYQPV
jgi:hypothetical protein